jgi:hypothetical protein
MRMKQEQLCLFDIGYEEKGMSQRGIEEPRGYIVRFIARTGRTYLVRYERRQAKEALRAWSSHPSKLFVYW